MKPTRIVIIAKAPIAGFCKTRLIPALGEQGATELAQRMTQGVMQAYGEIAPEPLMDVGIVGQSVLYMANLPLEANVMFHTVMATKMPFAGRG